MDVQSNGEILCVSLAVLITSILTITCGKDKKTTHFATSESEGVERSESSESSASKTAPKKKKRPRKHEKKARPEKKKREANEVAKKHAEPMKSAQLPPQELKSVAKDVQTAAQPLTERTARPIVEKKGDAPGSDPGDGEYEDVNLVEARAPTMKTTATTTTTATAANKSVLKTVVSELPPEENIVDALGEGEKLVVDAASKDAMSVNLKVEPPKATFKSTGGLSNHTLTNKSKARLVFKIKCSNNNEYGIHPVYGFIEAMASTIIMITRLPGNPKEDKAVIQWVETTADAKDPKEAFKNASPWSTQSIKVALVVVGDTPAAPKEKSAILPVVRGKPSVTGAKAAKKEKSTMQPVAVPAMPSAPAKIPITSPRQPAVPAAPVKVPVPAAAAAPVPAAAAPVPAVAAIKPIGSTPPFPIVPAIPPKPPVQIKPAPAAIKSPVPMPGAPALQPPAPPIAPIKPIGFQKPVSPAPITPFKPATVPAQKPLPTGPTTPPKPGVTIPAPAFPKAPVSRPTFGPAAPSTPMSSKRPSGAIIPLQPPAISRFPVPGGPPPAPAKGTSDLPVVSVYAVGGVGGGGPKSMVMPGVMAASPTSKPPK